MNTRLLIAVALGLACAVAAPAGADQITVTGVVSGPGGAAVAGAEVSAWNPGGGSADAVLTDSGGAFQLSVAAGTVHMSVVAPPALRLAQRILHLGQRDASFTADLSLEAGSLVTGLVLTSSGLPTTAAAWVGVDRVISQYTETEWLVTGVDPTTGGFSVVVPRDVVWLKAENVEPLYSPRIGIDTRGGDVSGVEIRLESLPIPLYGYDPPDPGLITVGEIDGLGEAEVVGAAGAALPLGRVVLVNMCSNHQATAVAGADGSFSARVFAPPGSALLIKHGPADRRWSEIEHGLAQGTSVFPGTILEISPVDGWPAFADVGADHVVADDLGETPNSIGAAWWLAGEALLDDPEVAPGGTFEVRGVLRVASPALDALSQAGSMSAGGFLSLAKVFDHEGRAVESVSTFHSTRLTPTGLPIQSSWRPRLSLGSVLVFSPFEVVDEHLVEAEFSATITVPTDLPPGTYRPIAEIGVPGSPATSSWVAVNLSGPTFYSAEAALAPIVVGGAPSGPAERRMIWRLFFDRPVLGTRGVGANQDAGRFQMATQIVTQGAAYVAPPFDLATGAPIRYRLEPQAPMMSFTDRRFPPRPWLPLRLPGGELRVTIAAPDGTLAELGAAPFVAARVDDSTTAAGWDLNPGTTQINNVYTLTTGDPAFEVVFEQYGLHVITMEGEVEDVWGNRYAGGGTYEVWVAHPLDLDLGVLPGTPLAVGDELNPTVHIHPPVPATVEMRVTRFPDSDPARATIDERVAVANRFGVLAAAVAAPTVDEAGEVRVETTARWVAPDGALFMGAQVWGGVVMTPPGEAELAAHGRRGLDCLEDIPPAWFIAEQDLVPPEGSVCHAYNAYHAGDILWSRLGEGTFGGESLIIAATMSDLQGSHRTTIADRYRRMAALDDDPEMVARFAAGEMPVFTSTLSGRSAAFFPDEIDQIGYSYRSSQRPGVRVREVVSDDSFDGGYWRLDTLYDDQAGVGTLGDQPEDFKLQYVGIVHRDLTSGVNQYLGQATGWVYMHDDDPGGTRVMPPYAGEGNGGWTTAGGPLLRDNGQPVDLFVVPTGTRPGEILEVGDRFRFAGHLMPPLPSRTEVTVTAPDTRSWTFETLANPVGYVYDSDGELVVDQPGVWTVTVRAWHDGACSGGSTIPPFPSGTVLGATSGSFEVYVVPAGGDELVLSSPSPGRLLVRGPAPAVVVRGRLPGEGSVRATITMPGRILQQGEVAVVDGAFELVYDPTALQQLFPSIDLVGRDDNGAGLADTVLITLFADGDGDAGPWYRATTVSLQGEQVAVGGRLRREGPRLPGGRVSP